MLEIKPSFYDNFYCIADKCDFTCCQEWAIGVDDDTLDKWEELVTPNSCGLSGKLCENVEDGAIVVNEKKKCPYLNEKGLCEVVLNYGEETLSHTCHTFPRVTYNYEDRREYTLNLGCKYAIKCLLDEGEFTVVSKEVDGDLDEDKLEISENLFKIRDFFLECCKDEDLSVHMLLKAIMYVVFELNEVWEMDDIDEATLEDYLQSDVFESVKKVLLEVEEDDYLLVDSFREGNEVLLDVLTSYYEEEMYSSFIDEIYDAANLLVETDRKEILEKLTTFRNEVEPLLEDKLKLILQNEIYGFIIPSEDDDPENMIRKLEWLCMEMVALKHWLFILWDKYGKIEPDTFVSVVAVLFRITGFNDDDIYEYLEDEFEDSIWDFGYINLIL